VAPVTFFGDGGYNYINFYGLWWSSTDVAEIVAWSLRLNYSDGSAEKITNWNKSCTLSTRCIKDAVTGIETIELPKKTRLKITDILGRDTEFVPNTVQIYHYSDGTIEKVFSVE
jgi:hypothetical protein